jgi:hypothetical protein
MSQVVVGIDPDADKYGIAMYVDGNLSALEKKSTVELLEFLQTCKECQAMTYTFVIEDVAINKFMYNRALKSPAIIGKVAQNVGECKHSQKVAEQLIEYYGFELIRQPPTKGNWAPAKNKKQFEQVTGWAWSSNEDTRSAAFMAFLHLNKIKQQEAKDAR